MFRSVTVFVISEPASSSTTSLSTEDEVVALIASLDTQTLSVLSDWLFGAVTSRRPEEMGEAEIRVDSVTRVEIPVEDRMSFVWFSR